MRTINYTRVIPSALAERETTLFGGAGAWKDVGELEEEREGATSRLQWRSQRQERDQLVRQGAYIPHDLVSSASVSCSGLT